jgi:hypothetical protein
MPQVLDSAIPRGFAAPPPFDFYTAPSHAAEIAFSPTGQHLLASNRGHDSLAVFAWSAVEEALREPAVWFPTPGRLPWHFAFGSATQLALTTQVRLTRRFPTFPPRLMRCSPLVF